MRLWTVDLQAAGALSVVSRPLGDELLMSEMEEVAEAGVDVLVSMMDHEELPLAGLVDEALAASVAGIRFIHEPTIDQHPPASNDRVLTVISELADDVRAGAHVAVHCHAGHGRSPAFVGGILVVLGMAPDEAMKALKTARGKKVPHRRAQVEWVRWVHEERSGYQPPRRG